MGEPEHTDVVVIGLGPGGEYAAGTLAEAGLHVTGVESRLVGGECPYFGCVPSKMMIRAANLIAETRRAPGLAGGSSVTPDWAPVARRIRDEATDDWNDQVAADRFTGKGGHLVRGRGKITAAGQVTVTGPEGTRVFHARTGIVINTGTDPAIPPIDGLDAVPFWTNREIVRAERVPESLIVLGGGAIGAELAQVFARFGAAVTVIEALPRLIAYEEPEASELLERIFKAEGITVRTGARADRVGHDGRRFTVHLGHEAYTAERLLVSTGRRTDLDALGVAAAGLRVSTGITQVPASARGWIHKAGNDGFIKVVADADRSVLVGASSAGPCGGEVLSALAVAVRAEVPLATLRNMPYAYPTFYRAIEAALADLAADLAEDRAA